MFGTPRERSPRNILILINYIELVKNNVLNKSKQMFLERDA